MADYQRGDGIPFLNDGAALFRKPKQRAQKSVDARLALKRLEKKKCELLNKHQRYLTLRSVAAIKAGLAEELETLETQIADTEREMAELRASEKGIGEYLDGHVAAVSPFGADGTRAGERTLRSARQDAGWDWLLREQGAGVGGWGAGNSIGRDACSALTLSGWCKDVEQIFDAPLERVAKEKQWDESEHPRQPAGSDKGGEFAPKDGAKGKSNPSGVEVGEVVFRFDVNQRVYIDAAGNKTTAPVYEKHFIPYQVVEIRKQSVMLRSLKYPMFDPEKVSFGKLKSVWHTQQQRDDSVWLHHNRQHLKNAISNTKDQSLLRRVAKLSPKFNLGDENIKGWHIASHLLDYNYDKGTAIAAARILGLRK